MVDFAERGSQKWLQIAVNDKPELLSAALRRSGALSDREDVAWKSPLRSARPPFAEFCDSRALAAAQIVGLRTPLKKFWPSRGPVWDAIGVTANGDPLFIEAKAHISEAASPATQAVAPASKELIQKSLIAARCHFARRSKCDWSRNFYQYSNRLAYQYFLRELNNVTSRLVFLYFLNDESLNQPATEEEWRGAIRLIHSVLGIPPDLKSHYIFETFVDVRSLV